MLMQATKAFVFKERRLASLIWLWGVLGTLMLFLLVDYLTTFTLLSKIPYLSDALLWLIPIYYFFTLFLSSRTYGSDLEASISTFFQFIGQMAVLLIFFSFWGVYSIFMTTDYQENTLWLEEDAPSFFTEETKLEYPSDAELIHSSYRKWGANGSRNIIFRVSDINSFGRKAFEKYEFTNPVMDFPSLGRNRLGEQNGNVLLPPLCRGFKAVTVVPRYFKVTREVTEPEDFCGERDALFTQIDYDTEIGVIMVILPKEKLVWLNSTGWF
jgi:hypothetical protein